MFGIGASEILVILIVVVVLLAMGKLPEAARKAGGAYRAYRQVDREVQKIKNPLNWIAPGEETKDDQPPERKS